MSNGLFKPQEAMTFTTAGTYYNQLLALCHNAQATQLVICLKDVPSWDSAALALLIEAKRLAKKYNKRLTVEGMQKEMKDLVVFCGLEGILNGE